MGDYYSKKLSAERLKKVYEIAPPRVRQYLRAEVDHVVSRLRAGRIVLELGCGYGRALGPLAGKAKLAIGIDTSMDSLAMAREELAGLKSIRLLQMDAARLGFADKTFDLVACVQNGISAFHVDQRALLAESVRVTRPGGTVLFSSYAEKFREQIDRDFGDQNLFLQSQVNIAEFMQRLLVRRFESSIFAFKTSLDNMIRSAQTIKDWYERLGKVPIYKKGKLPDIDALLDLDNEDAESEVDDINFELQLHEYVEKGLVLIDSSDLKASFIQDVERDIDLLQSIRGEWFGNDLPPDPKLDSLKKFLQRCLSDNPNRKIVVFTEFADTANYLRDSLDGDLRLFKYTSGDANMTNKRIIRANFDAGLPASKQKTNYDVLIATDAISEGFNLLARIIMPNPLAVARSSAKKTSIFVNATSPNEMESAQT